MFDEYTIHEIRTQLSILAGHASLLHWGRATPDEVIRVATRLLHATARIDALLGVALRGGEWVEGVVLEGERAPPGVVARTVAAQWAQEAKRRHVTLVVEDATGDAPEPAPAPAREIAALPVELILGNLVHNALKYGRPQGRVIVRALARASGVVFEVLDDGPGVPPGEVGVIFGRRVRGARATRGPQAQGGAGLGLALSRALAKRLGGALSYEEGRGGGCFVLVLPGVVAGVQAAPRPRATDADDAP